MGEGLVLGSCKRVRLCGLPDDVVHGELHREYFEVAATTRRMQRHGIDIGGGGGAELYTVLHSRLLQDLTNASPDAPSCCGGLLGIVGYAKVEAHCLGCGV